jgi:hypothetical protein
LSLEELRKSERRLPCDSRKTDGASSNPPREDPTPVLRLEIEPMRPKPYDDERLGLLLALLRAAPQAWVERAKRTPFAAEEVAELERMLEADVTFRKSYDSDPIAAAEAAGMGDAAARLEWELAELLSEPQEVVAHGKPTRLRALLLRSRAVRERFGL